MTQRTTESEPTVTTRQIRDLLAEAGRAGDLDQVYLCRVALGEEGDAGLTRDAARAECARVIANALAMEVES